VEECKVRSRVKALVLGATVSMWLAVLQVAAFAQGYPGGGNTPPPTVGGTKVFPGNDNMPRTGTDILLLLLIALTVLVIGLALHRLSRRAPSDI
jgi:hypothetical protein